jgi:lysophospholipase L1-like esterase
MQWDKRIACFGDSITEGRPGISYLRYLKKNYVNFGLGGDTLLGLTKRIEYYLSKHSCNTFIIEIGTNDILLPFLRKRTERWRKIVDRLIARGSVPLATRSDFAVEYERLICKLLDRKIFVVNIPCLGENLENDLNVKVRAYNEVIENLCQKYGITYIDFNGWQREIINNNPVSDYFISENPYVTLLDSLTTTYLDLSSWISNKRKLVLTVDGVHLNKRGAKGLADLIEKNVGGI